MYTDLWGKEHRYGPPKGYVQPIGQQNLGSAEWDALVARGLQFKPYSGADTHVRTARGTCLNPLVVAGDKLRVRPVADNETLADGGLYMIRWDDEAEVDAYRASINLKSTEPIFIAKFLRYFGGEWWCQCKDSLHRLNGVVVGQVVAALPAYRKNNYWKVLAGIAPPIDFSQVGLNAATDLFIGLNNTPDNITLAPNGFLLGNTIFTPGGPTFDCTAIVTVTRSAIQTAGTPGDMFILIAWQDDGSTTVWSPNQFPLTFALTNLTLQAQFPHLGSNAGLAKVRVGYNVTAGPAAGANANSCSVQVEFIKR